MSETTLTVADIIPAGLAENLTAANTDGSKFQCSTREDTFLDVANDGGGSINVTLEIQDASASAPGYGAVTLTDNVVAVAAGARKQIGPIGAKFIDADGYAHVTFSGVSSVTVQAKRLARLA
jgi:hypothetical protein